MVFRRTDNGTTRCERPEICRQETGETRREESSEGFAVKHRPHRRLSDARIRIIREQRAAGMTVESIAGFFDIDRGFASRLLTGDLRPNAGGPLAPKERCKMLTDPAVCAEIRRTLAVTTKYLNHAVSMKALAKRFKVDPRALQSRVDRELHLIDRFWSMVDRSGGPDACWRFQGGHLKRSDDLAKCPSRFVETAHKIHRAHRFGYELMLGPIPEGRILLHDRAALDPRCPNATFCANPEHFTPSKPKGRKR